MTIGASALLASFVTDRRFVLSIHRRHETLPDAEAAYRAVAGALKLLGLVLLALVVYRGFVGP